MTPWITTCIINPTSALFPSNACCTSKFPPTSNADIIVYPPQLSIMQVLLLGGHGKVALRLTPLLLSRAWNVTSVIRNPEHEPEILALGKGSKGKLNVLISSLDDVKSDADAKKVLDAVSPDYVVWSAGMRLPAPSFPSVWVKVIYMAAWLHGFCRSPLSPLYLIEAAARLKID